MLDSTSDVPIVSRMLCIDQHEIPMSTVRMPVRAAMAGPIVDPHGQSFLPIQGVKCVYAAAILLTARGCPLNV